MTFRLPNVSLRIRSLLGVGALWIAAVAPVLAQVPGGIRYVYSLDYPLAGKEAYLEWVARVAPTLSAPEELRRIASYDSYFATTPHRIIEFEFDDVSDAAVYFEREEIKAILYDVVNRGVNSAIMVLARRGDYYATEEGGAFKFVFSIDYPLGGRDVYLTWVSSIAAGLQEFPEVKRITSFDNYYVAQPHRVIEFEFDSMVEAARYFERPEVHAAIHGTQDHGINMDLEVLMLRSDYRGN